MEHKTGYIPYEISETRDERIYRWKIGNSDVVLKSVQLPGEKNSGLIVEYCGMKNASYVLKWGKDVLLRNSALFTGVSPYRVVVEGLEQRGRKYCFAIFTTEDGVERMITPILQFRTMIRYPYGRTFQDNYENLVQRFGQDSIVKYDLEYYTTGDSLENVRLFLGDTSCEGYMRHIYESVTKPDMTQMQKAVAIGKFIGLALHHNPIHLNLKEAVKAVVEFENNGWKNADIDKEVVWLMEQGHTRCGFINGFVSAALLRLADIPNEVFFGCGGHTTGKVLIDKVWYLWDVDAFKGELPLDDKGNLPSLEWLKQGDHIFMLDTLPSWEDSNPNEGWLRTSKGTRMTGYVGGGRYHSETGYGSSFMGGPKEYPPSIPIPLPVRYRRGKSVLLEWIGSYDRDGDFRDYKVELCDTSSGTVSTWKTQSTSLMVDIPEDGFKYSWRVKARDFHAKDTQYENRIFYTMSQPVDIPVDDVGSGGSPWELLGKSDYEGRTSVVTQNDSHDFTRIEGFDDKLGQTNYCFTELWKIKAGETDKSLYRLVDESNCWFNGCMARSLWRRTLDNPRKNQEGWHVTFVLHLNKSDIAGKSRFPFIWAGRDRYHLGFGLIIDPDKGLVYTGSNIYGDWRTGSCFEPSGWFRVDIINRAGMKIVEYYLNGELIHLQDERPFNEEIYDIDSIFVSSNPEAELDFIISDIII